MLTQLGADDFVRVRFGVGRPPEGWESADYVLGRFAPDREAYSIDECFLDLSGQPDAAGAEIDPRERARLRLPEDAQ